MALMTSGEKYLVADLDLADFGRREIGMAEHEMPGLMELRARYASQQPLSNVRVTGSLHLEHRLSGQVATFSLLKTMLPLQ